MRNLRLRPTLSTEVSCLPVPSLGLPRGAESHTCLAGLLQGRAGAEIFAYGKWSSFSAVLTAKSWRQKQEQLHQPWCILA